MTQDTPVTTRLDEGGRILRVTLDAQPGNILDRRVVGSLLDALSRIPAGALAILVDAQGPHFSYGARIEEHAPGAVEPALREFHALVRAMLGAPVPLVAAVRGRCLGGGVELAAACDVIFASNDATFATPEVRLGAFAPVASLLLPERMGAGNAQEMLLSGRTMLAEEALRTGLVQFVSAEPEEAALTWIREHLLGLSPASTRLAVRAARMLLCERVLGALDRVEALYLDELMRLPDAAEGVRAFLEKRAPRWGA